MRGKTGIWTSGPLGRLASPQGVLLARGFGVLAGSVALRGVRGTRGHEREHLTFQVMGRTTCRLKLKWWCSRSWLQGSLSFCVVSIHRCRRASGNQSKSSGLRTPTLTLRTLLKSCLTTLHQPSTHCCIPGVFQGHLRYSSMTWALLSLILRPLSVTHGP